MEPQIKVLQEWLCYHGFDVKIDGIFGPKTKAALQEFQKRSGLTPTGTTNTETMLTLTAPIKTVTQKLPGNKPLPQMIVDYAKLHHSVHPREIGGQNRGPFVRLYMNGKDGEAWPWCAGFVSYLLYQSCKSLDIPVPFKTSPSCFNLANNAKDAGLFVREKDPKLLKRETLIGSIFLIKKGGTWSHTGIVIGASEKNNVFQTIEGNTNDEGSSEGYEVCQRSRYYQDKDFIILG
jgi:hypothetical protein